MQKVSVIQDFSKPNLSDGKFHVRLIEGRFQNLRRLSSWPMIALFFGLVWIQYEGQPWLLFSFEQHRIILFGNAFSWRDLPLLSGLLIVGANLLFFVAVAYGRIWCGFACPQSLWTWMFIRIEQLIEGRANQRAKSDKGPMASDRLIRRIVKHAVWLTLALVTAISFTGYFVPIRTVLSDLSTLNSSPTLFGWLSIMTGLTYLNAGLIREKICLHACPYSRFQGVMFDRDTRTVSYDRMRGEPRAHQRHADEKSGDCVDCKLCIQVCPTGIDIRNGLQASCIDCAACIDACDNVMNKLNLPPGLIRFASENQLAKSGSPMLRPRLIFYGVVLVFVSTFLIVEFSKTTTLFASVQRDRNSLFIQLDENTICNDYRVKVEDVSNRQPLIDVSLSNQPLFELFGAKQIDMTLSDSVWHRYRVCTQDLDVARTSLTFNFIGTVDSISKTTTFLSASF